MATQTLVEENWDLLCFSIAFIFRYTRLIVHTVLYWTYKPVPIPEKPTLIPVNVTAMIATLGENISGLSEGIHCHIQAGCKYISICVPIARFDTVQDLSTHIAKKNDGVTIHVSKTNYANKRRQLRSAIESVPESRKKLHKVIVFADDDITFPNKTLLWMLAPFEDPRVGAVGTCQRTKRIETGSVLELVINWVFADYIQRRAFENTATLAIDDSISCLSGRMAALRAEIVENREFLDGFVSESWRGREMNADDDNYYTRHLLEGPWKIKVQCDDECQVETTFGTDIRELRRFVRWQRSNPRSNLKSLCKWENWQKYPWGTYSLYLSGFVNYGLPPDITLWFYWLRVTADYEQRMMWILFFFLWWLFTRIVKRVGLYRKNWNDVVFLSVSILWGWCHDFIKLYSLITINQTGW